MAVEDRAYVGGRVIEVARELDFLVADFRHARERGLEVFLHFVPHGVELESDLL